MNVLGVVRALLIRALSHHRHWPCRASTPGLLAVAAASLLCASPAAATAVHPFPTFRNETAAYVLRGSHYSFAAAVRQSPRMLGTLSDQRTGQIFTLSAPPGCAGPTGLMPIGPELMGGNWLAVDCADAVSTELELYNTMTGTWTSLIPAAGIQAYCNTPALGACVPVAVGNDWVEFDEQCYHCADTYVYQNIQTGSNQAVAESPVTTAQFRTASTPPTITRASQAAASPSYGIADAPSVCASWTSSTCNAWTYGFASYYATGFNYFTELKNNLPLSYARFSVPYDAFEVWSGTGSQCVTSPAWNQGDPQHGGLGQLWWNTLLTELRDAQAIGLQPMIVLQAGTGAGGIPKYPDPTVKSDYLNFQCGVEGLMNLTTYAGVPVSHWEAFNEPDGACEYNNATSQHPVCTNGTGTYATGAACSTTSGGDRATYLWVAAWEADGALNRSDHIAAATFSHPSLGYLSDYYCNLSQNIGLWPSYWSFHAYNDAGSWVDGPPDSGSYNFDEKLYSDYKSAGQAQPYVWISEAASDLSSLDTSFSNGSSTNGCNNGEPGDANTLGACLDRSPLQQENAAPNFLNLASAGAAFAGQITQVYWFQFQPANASTGFDSGLISPPSGVYVSPDGQYGQPRQSFCVLARLSSSQCSSSVVDARNWSSNPGPAGGE